MAAENLPSLVGQRFGNYRIVRKIGEGGMGAVYEAVHEQLGRKAAIKVLHPEYSQNPQVASRFFNEARAVNIVQHPGIVAIYEFGQAPDHTAYIIMEFLEGEPLSKRLRRLGGTLGVEALRIGRQMASALTVAHERGIVHRDLKPDNVMVVPDLEALSGERAKILDFGIAKVTEGEGGASMKTRTGMIMGTPTYMSPEQCRGAGGVDAKSDVYSLGVMLYEMLSGRQPFVSEGMGELMAMHMFTAPLPLQQVQPAASDDLARLVHGMLAKKAEERPTMAQVAAELEELGAPRATKSMPATTEGTVLGGQRNSKIGLRTPRSSTLQEAAAQVGLTRPNAAPAAPPSRRLLYVASAFVATFVLLAGVTRALRERHPTAGAAGPRQALEAPVSRPPPAEPPPAGPRPEVKVPPPAAPAPAAPEASAAAPGPAAPPEHTARPSRSGKGRDKGSHSRRRNKREIGDDDIEVLK